MLRSPLDALGCALFPASCSLCGHPLPQVSAAPVCASCWHEVLPQTEHVCARCGDILETPLLAGDPEKASCCRICRLAPPPFVRAVAYGAYQDRMRAAIHALKYQRLHPAADFLGKMLARAIGQLAGEAPAAMLVVPIPLHRSKHTERGFNQARTLTEHALRSLRTTHPTWQLELAPGSLMRLRATKSQAGLTSRGRRQNVRGAFIVSDSSAVTAKHILLIDDIFTTGATVRAAARALLSSGAASVRVATLARARMVNQRPALANRQSAADPAAAAHSQAHIDRSLHETSNHEPSFDEG